MWSSRLFLKLFLAYAGLIVLTIAACSAIVAGWQEDQLVRQVQRRLHDSATLIGDSLGGEVLQGSSSDLQKKTFALGVDTKTRFTLVDAAGKVIADSEQASLEGVAAMDNHLSRQEFVQAQRSGSGTSRRLSATLQVPFLYYVLAIEQEGKTIGYVRAAQPISQVLEEVAEVRRLIWLVGLAVGLAGLVVTYWLTGRIVKPIHSLTEAAEEMTAGQLPQRVRISSNDEIGTLARTFERMVDKLSRRERALRESSDRQSTVLRGMNEGVLALNDMQQVLFANVAAGNMLGFIPDQVEKLTLLEVVRSNDLNELVQKVLASEQRAQCELEWQLETPHTLEVTANPLPGDPCPGVVLVLHDVTELKRLEGLRQEFVANVSHELKTPLSSIKAYTETLLGGALEDGENARRFLDRIDDQTDRLHELILDMLALARIESGKSPLELAEVSLSQVAGASVADNEQQAQSANVVLINKIAQSDLKVVADQEALRQVFNNLIDNGLKYVRPEGSVTIRCREDSGMAVIEVADTGPGIDPKHHNRLFERFYRVDKARSREVGGTGLGLAIVKHLCEAMGGEIAVESEPGKGSIFRVKLPLSEG